MKVKKAPWLALIMTLCILLQSSQIIPVFASSDDLPVNWNLGYMYESESDFQESLQYVKETASKEIQSYKGKLNDDTALLNCLKLYEKASIEGTKLFVYASMLQDTDSTNTNYNRLKSEATSATADFENASAFINEEILLRSDDNLMAVASKSEFMKYKSFIEGLVATREHALSEEAQSIMAQLTPITQMPEEIYTQITLSDAKYGTFVNHKGVEDTFNPDVDTLYLYADDSEMRERAWAALYSPYQQMENSIAATYIAEVEKNAFQAKVYGYDSSLAYAVSGTIEPETYKALIQASRDNVHVYQNYLKMKRDILGLKELKTSDLHLSYATEFARSYEYEEAVEVVKEALKPLGTQYGNRLNNYFTKGYIDVYPDEFKTTSQYSWGAYGSPTYVLLNYNNGLNDVSTVAHELGHAMNQEYINTTQSFFDTNMTPFPAEVASTFNELMLMDYLNQNTTDKEEQLAYTQHELDFFMQTFFEQVILADFEMQVYEKVDQGEALTLESLNNLFLETVSFYYGDVVEVEPFYVYHWMSIPHLYQNHYVYSYSMSVAVAQKVKEMVDNGGDNAIKDYETFLSVGSSLAPEESLMNLGVDINSTDLYEAAFKRMDLLTNLIFTQLDDPELNRQQIPSLMSMKDIEAYLKFISESDDQEPSLVETTEKEPLSDQLVDWLLISTLTAIVILVIAIIILCISKAKLRNKSNALLEENQYLKNQFPEEDEDKSDFV